MESVEPLRVSVSVDLVQMVIKRLDEIAHPKVTFSENTEEMRKEAQQIRHHAATQLQAEIMGWLP